MTVTAASEQVDTTAVPKQVSTATVPKQVIMQAVPEPAMSEQVSTTAVQEQWGTAAVSHQFVTRAELDNMDMASPLVDDSDGGLLLDCIVGLAVKRRDCKPIRLQSGRWEPHRSSVGLRSRCCHDRPIRRC